METVFLAYPFTEDARRLALLVETLLWSHEIRAITGEVNEGAALTPGVMAKISAADGLIALFTPHHQVEGRDAPSTWVVQELTHARGQNLPAIAIVQSGVISEGAYAENEHIAYDPADGLPAFLKLGETIGAWKRSRGRRVKVRILPSELEQVLGEDPNAECEYRLTGESDGNEILQWSQAPVRLEPGGAFAYLDGVRHDALVELKLQLPRRLWNSRATPQWLHVELRERP